MSQNTPYSPVFRVSRTFWKNVLALIGGFLLVTVLLVNVGVPKVADALAGAVAGYILLAVLAYLAFFLLRGVRWKWLLRRSAPAASVSTAASLSAFGWLVSTFVPMKAGDVARATMLSRRERAPFATVVGTVAVERLLDVLGLAAMASIGLLGAAILAHAHLPPLLGDLLAIAWVLPILSLAILLTLAGTLRQHRERNALLRFAARFLDAVDELRGTPLRIWGLFGLSLLITGAQVSVFVLLFLAFDPSAFAPLVAAGVPFFLLSFAVPIVPGHVGTYEVAFIFVFHSLGFALDLLQPMAIAVHVLTVSIVTLLGGLGFVVERLTRVHLSTQPSGAGAAP